MGKSKYGGTKRYHKERKRSTGEKAELVDPVASNGAQELKMTQRLRTGLVSRQRLFSSPWRTRTIEHLLHFRVTASPG